MLAFLGGSLPVVVGGEAWRCWLDVLCGRVLFWALSPVIWAFRPFRCLDGVSSILIVRLVPCIEALGFSGV